MAIKYFSGDVELKGITYMPNKDFAVLFPGVKGKRWDGISMMVGDPTDFIETFDRAAGKWRHDYRPVDRVIRYKDRPSLHECDARCMNATGRTMNCECSCGGKNHGRGAFNCTEAA